MIRFNNSQLPSLAKPKFVKISIDQEENEIPSTDISHLFGDDDSKVNQYAEEFITMVRNAFVNKMQNMMGLTGPDADSDANMSISIYLHHLNTLNIDELDEKSARRYNNVRQHVLDEVGRFASRNGNMNLFMIAHKLYHENKNPFSFADVKEATKEVLDEIK